ncbi:hypothetical protein ACO0RG_001286 [Hanseniaspora osmophila]|uniref:Serine-threonine kinase receptor-associated protein n=1 Tax=Hanseniaspora osmophila TaxID=56408 RepID=A0A1E5RP07_9ASCO|nr:Eukaryotic translation initiation factor 3 subunit I [Hanseniaspora osmophila]
MRPIQMFGHSRPVSQIRYNRDGDIIVSVSADESASIWYSNSGERIGTFNGHNGSINSVDISSNSKFCCTGSGDSTIKIWKLENGQELQTIEYLPYIECVEFSPVDNKYLLVITAGVFKTHGCIDVYAFDNETGKIGEIVFKIERNPEVDSFMEFKRASWSFDSKYIIIGCKDGQILKYDVEARKIVHQEQLHKLIINDIQFSPDRTYFITASKDRFSKMVDVMTMKTLKQYESTGPLNSACICPLKDFVIIGGGQEARDVTTTGSKEGNFESRFFHKIFETEIGRISGHFGPINGLAVSPQGNNFASASEDGYIRLHHFEKNYFDFKFDVEKTQAALAS